MKRKPVFVGDGDVKAHSGHNRKREIYAKPSAMTTNSLGIFVAGGELWCEPRPSKSEEA